MAVVAPPRRWVQTPRRAYSYFPTMSANSRFALEDQTEVCSLSRKVMSQPLSVPLQHSVRLLHPLLPALPTAFLTVCLPRGQRYGLTTFPACHTTGLGPAFLPGTIMATYSHIPRKQPIPHRLVHACQSFWHVFSNDIHQQFTCVALTSQPSASTRYDSELLPPASRPKGTHTGGYIVRRASYSTVTSEACLHRLPLVAQRVRYHSILAMAGQ